VREVVESTGVPLDHLVTELGLPRGFDPEERIGRIRKRYDISPDNVRRVLKEYGATHRSPRRDRYPLKHEAVKCRFQGHRV
jgi:hypothetical protein